MQVDVYDYNLLKKGVFLGCLILKGEELLEFLNNNNVNAQNNQNQQINNQSIKKRDQKFMKKFESTKLGENNV
jgi:hypothetical protein